MNIEKINLDAGLYFVATPIGSARDITLRALDVLNSADVLVAEDTRTLRRLMQIHGVALRDRAILAYHDHNGAKMRPRLLGLIKAGNSVAYTSDAGTPMIADPGFQLAKDALDTGYLVTSAPGPSAAITALSISGLPTDRFLFAGFPPAAKGARMRWLKEVTDVAGTAVIYETPKRIHRILGELAEVAGQERQAAICRELTKRFEEVVRGSLAELIAQSNEMVLKGEIVLLVDRNRQDPSTESAEDAVRDALKEMSVKDAATHVADKLGLPRRQIYQLALEIGKKT